ncbi:hypothetical protein TNCV_4400031 [Trichonephila clavipes]|nr:hypothetical protein TNCV_4400031 [Trichonephila clavipes]
MDGSVRMRCLPQSDCCFLHLHRLVMVVLCFGEDLKDETDTDNSFLPKVIFSEETTSKAGPEETTIINIAALGGDDKSLIFLRNANVTVKRIRFAVDWPKKK